MDRAEKLKQAELSPDFTVEGYLRGVRDLRRKLMGTPPHGEASRAEIAAPPVHLPAIKIGRPVARIPEPVREPEPRENPAEEPVNEPTVPIKKQPEPETSVLPITSEHILAAACEQFGALMKEVLGFTMKSAPFHARSAVQILINQHVGMDGLLEVFPRWNRDGLEIGLEEANDLVAKDLGFSEMLEKIRFSLGLRTR